MSYLPPPFLAFVFGCAGLAVAFAALDSAPPAYREAQLGRACSALAGGLASLATTALIHLGSFLFLTVAAWAFRRRCLRTPVVVDADAQFNVTRGIFRDSYFIIDMDSHSVSVNDSWGWVVEVRGRDE